jgi:hypothetical protein
MRQLPDYNPPSEEVAQTRTLANCRAAASRVKWWSTPARSLPCSWLPGSGLQREEDKEVVHASESPARRSCCRCCYCCCYSSSSGGGGDGGCSSGACGCCGRCSCRSVVHIGSPAAILSEPAPLNKLSLSVHMPLCVLPSPSRQDLQRHLGTATPPPPPAALDLPDGPTAKTPPHFP